MRNIVGAGLIVTAALISAPANAVILFSGYTDGCFSTSTCTPTNPVPPPNQSVTFEGLKFTGSTFTNKPLGTINLGTFILSAQTVTDLYTGENFDLLVTFTAPSGSANYAFDLKGSVAHNNDDGSIKIFLTSAPVDIFDNGLYRLTVNDPNGGLKINVGDDPLTLTGTISAVPEPSTWAMIIFGFLGVGFLAYHRRSTTSFRIT
jgi:hypothetical protein